MLCIYLDVLYLLKLWPKKEITRNRRLQNDDNDVTLHWPEHASTQLLMADYLRHNPGVKITSRQWARWSEEISKTVEEEFPLKNYIVEEIGSQRTTKSLRT